MIYLVEDDDNIRELEEYALRSGGFDTKSFANGSDFFAACREELPDLVLLDIMLPEEDGLQILRRLRADPSAGAVPVIMVTAKTTELDVVKGLDLGADDYIPKPFGVMELISRVKAVLRRTERTAAPEPETVLSCGEIRMDDKQRVVTAGGSVCELTYKEYELLKLLLRNQRLVLTREKILQSVWGYSFEGETRTVDMHIKTLRQKLGASGSLIRTVRNVGYKIEA